MKGKGKGGGLPERTNGLHPESDVGDEVSVLDVDVQVLVTATFHKFHRPFQVQGIGGGDGRGDSDHGNAPPLLYIPIQFSRSQKLSAKSK